MGWGGSCEREGWVYISFDKGGKRGKIERGEEFLDRNI